MVGADNHADCGHGHASRDNGRMPPPVELATFSRRRLTHTVYEPKEVSRYIGWLRFIGLALGYITKNENTSSCEIEDFVETHLCKLCVILRSRVLRVVCPL